MGIHNFSGQPLQCLTNLTIKKKKKNLPYIQCKSTIFEFKTIAPCSVTRDPGKTSVSTCPTNSHNKVSAEPSLLQAEQSQLSQPFFTGEVFQASGSVCRHRTPSGVSWERSRGRESPPLTFWPRFFWCSPGRDWLPGLQAYIPSSYTIIHPPVSPSPSPWGCSQSIHPPVYTDIWNIPDAGAGPCTWPGWTSWGSHGPTPQACQACSGWHLFPRAYQLHHTPCCHPQTCWGCTRSHCLCH